MNNYITLYHNKEMTAQCTELRRHTVCIRVCWIYWTPREDVERRKAISQPDRMFYRHSQENYLWILS